MPDPVVAVALSGGVDSLVAGFLLKQRFRRVMGLHFTTGYEKAPIDTQNLENQLRIPVTVVDLSGIFEREVVDYFTATYLKGKTPNPCLVCNQKIKFGALLSEAEKLGADMLATGHYARVVNRISFPRQKIARGYLEKGADPVKDQSYFLSRLTGSQLDKILFPLAELTKPMVRAIAAEHDLAPLSPGESQDICFIHDRGFAQFIIDKKGMHPQKGPIKDMDGRRVGTHNGLHTFTVGQRRGINCPAAEPYYVREIDLAHNTLHVCFKKDLARTDMRVADIIWHGDDPGPVFEGIIKIRYNHKGARATLEREGTTGRVRFRAPLNAVTPGQAAVFYSGSRVAGSGIIQ